MITAKEVSDKRFEKAAFGYKQEEVDEFLTYLINELNDMQEQRADMHSKMQILADKVREYKNDEEALKDALLGAQKQGHKVVSEAQEKAQQIMADAKEKAAKIVAEAEEKYEQAVIKNQAQIDKEKEILLRTQREVADFKKSLFDMYKSHLEAISSMPDYDDDDESDNSTENDKKADDNKLQSADNSTKNNDKKPEPVPETEKKVDPFATSSFNAIKNNGVHFGELQFGQNNK